MGHQPSGGKRRESHIRAGLHQLLSVSERQKKTTIGKNVEKREPSRTVIANVTDEATVNSNMEVSQKAKNRNTI